MSKTYLVPTPPPMLPDKVALCHYGQVHNSGWKKQMAEMLRRYIRGETIYVEFQQNADPRRIGAVGKLYIKPDCIQAFLKGRRNTWIYSPTPKNEPDIEVKEENVKEEHFGSIMLDGFIKWDGRTNKVDANAGWAINWLPHRTEEEGTFWKWERTEKPAAPAPKDKLDREIKVGDFISYVLYNFDNARNSAGIYYGKVTKIDNEGYVFAKNIKLAENDKSAEKRIKDNSLIVIMSKDLMEKLMVARLSIL